MTRSRLVALVTVLALVFAACGGDDTGAGNGNGNGNGNGSGSGADGADLPDCPLDALEAAAKPVSITFWHAMTRANEEALVRLTDAFNASQEDVRVTLSAAPSYRDQITRFRGALGTGNLPDLLQAEDTALQLMIDSGAALPAAACVEADDYDTSDHVERVLSYYTVQDVLWPMPFNVSNPVLYYNKAVFAAAGLDPEDPPATLDEVRAASQAIVDAGAAPYGISFKTDAWFFEHWLAKAGHTYVNNGNGREDRATEVTFADETGIELFTWLDEMADDRLLLSTGPGDLEHYLAVGNGQAAMTIDSSAALGTIFQILGGGEFPNVDLGAGRMPGPESDDGGLLVGGAALYIMARSAPEKQAAAWRFAEYLNEAQTQAEWAAATGYVPVRRSATELSPLTDAYAEQPYLRIAFDQLLSGAENTATAGPVIGAYGSRGEGVRGAVIDAVQRMFTENVAPADALRTAAEAANRAIQEYNVRIG